MIIKKFIVRLRMWYADIRGHHGKKWNYDPGDWYLGRNNMKITNINLNKYQKHWIHTRPYGHDIVIFSKPNNKMVIKCKWPDKVRDKNGRVYDTGR